MQLPERIQLPFDLGSFQNIIDVRSPGEYDEDHIPGAINLPVLDDAQRKAIGILHASDAFEARRTGATLITENIHRHLTTALATQPKDFSPLIYCWRGNLRSNAMATIFRNIGWRARVLEGGYKAWRKWLMEDLKTSLEKKHPQFIVLEGLTGCGKTRLLHALKEQGAQILDLEGHANHKGSVLGGMKSCSQPSQKAFETLLWEHFRNYDLTRPIFTEAESNRIGKIHLPGALWKRLRDAQVVQISLPLAERAQFLLDDYPHFIEQPQRLKTLLDHLRRLRGHQLVDLWHQQIDQHEWTSFLESILTHHYDPAYRSAGSAESIYQKPAFFIEIPSINSQSLQKHAAALIAHYHS